MKGGFGATYRVPAMALVDRIWFLSIAISPKKSPLLREVELLNFTQNKDY
jgi:hypothetical protein